MRLTHDALGVWFAAHDGKCLIQVAPHRPNCGIWLRRLPHVRVGHWCAVFAGGSELRSVATCADVQSGSRGARNDPADTEVV
jgi:hypothetical protein